jgi:hypothetical protein
MKKPDYTIATQDGGPGEITVEHAPEYPWGRIRMAIDLSPWRNSKRLVGDYLAVYLTPKEARRVASALQAVTEGSARLTVTMLATATEEGNEQ